jgi:hypothetical protein
MAVHMNRRLVEEYKERMKKANRLVELTNYPGGQGTRLICSMVEMKRRVR